MSRCGAWAGCCEPSTVEVGVVPGVGGAVALGTGVDVGAEVTVGVSVAVGSGVDLGVGWAQAASSNPPNRAKASMRYLVPNALMVSKFSGIDIRGEWLEWLSVRSGRSLGFWQ